LEAETHIELQKVGTEGGKKIRVGQLGKNAKNFRVTLMIQWRGKNNVYFRTDEGTGFLEILKGGERNEEED